MIERFGDDRDWFFEKRFGLFVHWGLYAIPAWHEQIQQIKVIPREEYEPYAKDFNPTNFAPDAWIDLAIETGMGYICLTTKHHDGFCLFDTAETDYNIMNSPYGKDLIKELADACHKRDFPLCFYYSVADWHNINYPNEGRHHELLVQPNDEPDILKYTEYVRAQIRELCTNYGKVSCIWWDMNVPEHIDKSVNDMIRELQPAAVINDRGFDPGDFGTPERDYDQATRNARSFDRLTEACQSLGSKSWGYKTDDDYYGIEHIKRSMDSFMSKGANYLLNVGPMADGTIPQVQVDMLKEIGTWFNGVKESYIGTDPVSEKTHNQDILLTENGNSLYVHLYKMPSESSLSLMPINTLPAKAVLLNDGRELPCRVDVLPKIFEPYLQVYDLPIEQYAGDVMVLRLDFPDGIPG